MGSVNLDNTGSGSAVTLSSDGTSLLLDGTAIGGSPDLYAENPSSATAPSATGANAVAIGTGASATGLYAFAAGNGALASGSSSVSLGLGSTASNTWANAIGRNTTASAGRSSAIGNNSAAGGSQAVTGLGAMALGGSYASGTDSFAAAIANNTSSYGATGANSVAMGQQAKATGQKSFSGGYFAEATGTYSYSFGRQAQATQEGSVAWGSFAKSSIAGKVAIGGHSPNNIGDSQAGILNLYADTTGNTPEALTSNNTTPSATNQVILPNNSAYSFSGTIIAREQASAGSDYASWEIKGALLRDANAASTVLGNGIQNKMYATSGASAWAIALTADTTNGGLKIEVTGAASTNIRWVATVNTSEVTY